MGLVRVVEPVRDFPVVVGIMRVTQLQGLGNEFGLLARIQQRHFTFELLKTLEAILTRNRLNARVVGKQTRQDFNR